MELCGHATLAASKTLLLLHPEVDIFRFQTKSGQLTARRSGVDVIISLPIPALDPTDQKSSAKLISELQQAIGIAEADLVAASTLEWGDGSAIFELGSDVDLLGLKFDIKALVSYRLRQC